MAALLPVTEALDRILAGAAPLPATALPLADALGRVLDEDLIAKRTQPPAPLSAMDGYAVRGADVSQAPARLTLIGEVAAGHPFDGEVRAGQAARISTGGVMPNGADTVVIQEHTSRDSDVVVINRATAAGRNVRRAGIDFHQGDKLVAKGRRLTDRDLMLAAAMNYPTVRVIRPPRVAVLGTGDELVMPGREPGPGEIVYSNGYALSALVRSEGGAVIDLGIAKDRVEDIVGAVRNARDAGADVLVTSGGASVGEHDLVQRALAREGLDLSFWRVALRPGRPMLHGRLGAMQVLGVPGNPVSSYVCAFLFLVPLLRRLAGRADFMHVPRHGRLGTDLAANDERADYLRATLATGDDGTAIVTPVPVQDSSLMALLAKADCLLIREPHAPVAAACSPCIYLKLGF
jgi:molybdopterin molybdotransferase